MNPTQERKHATDGDVIVTMDLDSETEHELLEEICCHLEDKARWLMLSGLAEEESMEKAVEAFGDPAES